MKMTAAVLMQCGAPRPFAHSRPVEILEVELEPPGPGEVLVKIGGAGLCHSDLSLLNGDRPRPVPMVLGHEGSGICVEAGPGVHDIGPDDHIVFQFGSACERCRRCLEGRPQVCETAARTKGQGRLMSGERRLKLNGDYIAHHTGISCMAEYAVVDRGTCVVVDRRIDIEEAAIFGCAVMTGAGAVINTARVRAGDSVAIIGLGGVGLNGLLGAKLAGAGQIIAVDLEDSKLGLARQLGATHTVNARDADHIEQIRDISNGGVDFAIELAGTIKAMETAWNSIRYGGAVVTAGLSPAAADFSFNQSELVAQEKSILGSYMGSCVPVRDIPRFIDLYMQGRMPVDRLIDRKIGFGEINAGFDKLQDVAAVRQILAPHSA